jgi:hypothetical protein
MTTFHIIINIQSLDHLTPPTLAPHHHRVVRSSTRDPWRQTAVKCADPAFGGDLSAQESSMETGPWEEVTEPLEDALLMRSLDAVYR